LLYSMFRVDATPVECPFKGPLSFTYNRGHGECRSPVSSIDSCTEGSRLLLRYQACPDVHGTESTGKEAVEQIPSHFTASEVRCVVALVSGEQRRGLCRHYSALLCMYFPQERNI